MSARPSLFADPVVAAPPGVTLILGDTSEAVAEARRHGGARLVIADPPWGGYERRPGVVAPDGVFPCLTLGEIAEHLDATAEAARPDARLVVWHCWPLLVEMIGDLARCAATGSDRTEDADRVAVLHPARWEPVTGGAWVKSPHQGVGFHWLGRSEPVLVYRRASPPTDRGVDLGNAHVSEPGDHSAKPEEWHEAMIRRWTEPGDLVLDLYAGLGGIARACARSGRRYVGAEIDPKRHAMALGFTASNRRLA